jgi:hypothetical protein
MDRSLRRLSPKLRRAARVPRNARPARLARKLKLSPKRRAQLKLQGLYIGYIRQLKPRQKMEVKRLRETKGMQKAIALAQRLMK